MQPASNDTTWSGLSRIHPTRIAINGFCSTGKSGCLHMTDPYHAYSQHLIELGGRPLTRADLPAPEPVRWVVRRKAEVVAAVRGGLLSLEEACSRYMLSLEEINAWQHALDRYGLGGLRTTRVRRCCQPRPSANRPHPENLIEGLAQCPAGRRRLGN
jgi:hypothetical protein